MYVASRCVWLSLRLAASVASVAAQAETDIAGDARGGGLCCVLLRPVASCCVYRVRCGAANEIAADTPPFAGVREGGGGHCLYCVSLRLTASVAEQKRGPYCV